MDKRTIEWILAAMRLQSSTTDHRKGSRIPLREGRLGYIAHDVLPKELA